MGTAGVPNNHLVHKVTVTQCALFFRRPRISWFEGASKAQQLRLGSNVKLLLTSNLSANLQLLRYKHAYSVNKVPGVFDGAIFHFLNSVGTNKQAPLLRSTSSGSPAASRFDIKFAWTHVLGGRSTVHATDWAVPMKSMAEPPSMSISYTLILTSCN